MFISVLWDKQLVLYITVLTENENALDYTMIISPSSVAYDI